MTVPIKAIAVNLGNFPQIVKIDDGWPRQVGSLSRGLQGVFCYILRNSKFGQSDISLQTRDCHKFIYDSTSSMSDI